MPTTTFNPARATGMSALLILISLLWSAGAVADEWQFQAPGRIVAIGDVHGAYGALTETLQVAGVIDSKLGWSGGDTHLVFTGDLLDRGARSRDVMDLVMRLEQEATSAGGRVHLLLGNHEVMNLTGDLRYVADEEYAAFLDVESPEERESWYQHFRSSKPDDSEEDALRSEFDRKAPAGFFGHRRAFRHDGHYGSWLLTKPFMVVVNDTAFVHGGAPPLVANQGLVGVNVGLKKDLYDYVVTRDELADQRFMSPIDRFKEIPAMLEQRDAEQQIPPELLEATQRITTLSKSDLHGPAGPTWYRGTATCGSLVEADYLRAALENIGAERIVIGHTTAVTRQIQQRMNGRIVEVDTGMLHTTYEGSGNALVIEGDTLTAFNQHRQEPVPLVEHPIGVSQETLGIDDDTLAELLAYGEIVFQGPPGPGWQWLVIQSGEQRVTAIFHPVRDPRGFNPELAAFKLDRLLGLNMVPVTVERTIDNQAGVLQFVPGDTFSELTRAAANRWTGANCPFEKQAVAMNVFDTLLNNASRSPSRMLYSENHWLLILVDHGQAFNISTHPNVRTREISVGEEWRMALSNLDDATLKEELGDLLGKSRLKALMRRRDMLIKLSSMAVAK